jgi:glycosyltransferase involved in cell wall biosynthesis
MKVKNKTNNTVYIEDIDAHFPFQEEPLILDPDLLKKSKGLRGFIINGLFDVVEYDPNERIEASIIYLRNKIKATSPAPDPEIVEVIDSPPTEIELKKTDCIEVLFHGIVYDSGGYAKVNRNLIAKLVEAGVKLKVDPIKSQNDLKESELRPFQSLTQTKLSRNFISIDSIIPSFAECSNSKYKVLYTTIESYSVPNQFLQCCEMYDEIWITSDWSKGILEQYTKKPIYLVPAGSDPILYTEEGPRLDFKPNIKNFVFLSVFGWGYRKGYDVLLNSYFDEFSAEDDVSLLLVSKYQGGSSRFHRNKIRDDINAIMRNFPNKALPHVVRYSQNIPECQMPQVYRSANCFVLPSRGEGSNLTAVEASLCGLPVIMTNVSGQQMYLRDDNAFLIEMDFLQTLKPGQSHIHYWDNQKFPSLTSPQVKADVKTAMRYVLNNEVAAKSQNKNLQRLIKDNFTWTHTANAAIERLTAIKQKMEK